MPMKRHTTRTSEETVTLRLCGADVATILRRMKGETSEDAAFALRAPEPRERMEVTVRFEVPRGGDYSGVAVEFDDEPLLVVEARYVERPA